MDYPKIFITMHDLSPDARVVYASESITDVLGYEPADVIGTSCFDFFHPDELPFARKVHGRGVHLDKAAMLAYCQVKHQDGHFVTCETIFSVVYDVFVAATSLYSNSSKSQGRAITAPVIRRVFSASANDPKYNMLTHLSTKFRTQQPSEQHEPRAALILNRFTRSLTVLYASHAMSSIFGIDPDEMTGKSFYECIQEDCLQNAVDALERAKENDSIAYLRFRWRNPIAEDAARAPPPAPLPPPEPERRSLRRSTRLANSKRKRDDDQGPGEVTEPSGRGRKRIAKAKGRGVAVPEPEPEPSSSAAPLVEVIPPSQPDSEEQDPVREVEAVVSCTSDGLVVVLRRARPLIPKPLHDLPEAGIFASPWAPAPLVPNVAGNGQSAVTTAAGSKTSEASFMETIRDVAVFAWSLRELGAEIVMPSPPDSEGIYSGDENASKGITAYTVDDKGKGKLLSPPSRRPPKFKTESSSGASTAGSATRRSRSRDTQSTAVTPPETVENPIDRQSPAKKLKRTPKK